MFLDFEKAVKLNGVKIGKNRACVEPSSRQIGPNGVLKPALGLRTTSSLVITDHLGVQIDFMTSFGLPRPRGQFLSSFHVKY